MQPNALNESYSSTSTDFSQMVEDAYIHERLKTHGMQHLVMEIDLEQLRENNSCSRPPRDYQHAPNDATIKRESVITNDRDGIHKTNNPSTARVFKTQRKLTTKM